MRTASTGPARRQLLDVTTRLALGARFMLAWLSASVQMAATVALLALCADATGWTPFLVRSPAERLGWVVLLGAIAGLAEVVDVRVFRRPP